MEVTKEVTFDCAHMLSGYKGLCSNLHGHTYKLQVTLCGTVDSETHMLMDFNLLKEMIQEEVMARFDHATVFSSPKYRNCVEEAIFGTCSIYELKFFEMPTIYPRSTAECMARYIQSRFKQRMNGLRPITISQIKVKLWETPTSFVEV